MDGFKSLPKMQCFKEGGSVKPKAMCYGGKMKKGGEVDKTDIAQDKKVVKKAFAMHDKQEHPGEKTDLSKLKKGGRSKKEAGTVRKYKAGGDVTNVYEAKKKAGDKDAIKKVKQITPAKAASSSAAMKGVGNTTAAFKKGGNVSEAGKKAGDKDVSVKTKMKPFKAATKSAAMKKGGKVKKYAGDTNGSYVDVKDPQALTDKIAREENAADRELVMRPIRAVGKALDKGINTVKSAFKGQGAMSDEERSNIAKKKGGKVKKFAEGGFTAEEEKWLGGADRTDPIILARMRAAMGDRPAATVPTTQPAAIEDESGRGNVTAAQQNFNKSIPGSGAYMAANPAPTAPIRRATSAPYSIDNGPEYTGPQKGATQPYSIDNGPEYTGPQKGATQSFAQRFFNASPAEQAAQFNQGVQARKNFPKRLTGTPITSFDAQLASLNKPKV
jgi:hypothetical protein